MRNNRVLIFSICMIFVLSMSFASCGSDTETTKKTAKSEKTVDLKNPEYLTIEDIKVGTGDKIKAGDKIAMFYKGTLMNGKQFDAKERPAKITKGATDMAFEFTLGAGEVIAGWDQGLVGMRVGGKRILYIPSELAYGKKGSGSNIPPDSPLKFVVELYKIVKKGK